MKERPRLVHRYSELFRSVFHFTAATQRIFGTFVLSMTAALFSMSPVFGLVCSKAALFSVLLIMDSTVFGVVCPKAASEVVDPWVSANWNPAMLNGTFYELALHDYTQPRNVCGCERSVKVVDNDGGIADAFSIRCPPTATGKDYVVPLTFVQTGIPGCMNGTLGAGRMNWPDYIVDVGTRQLEEPYPWVIEFQCVDTSSRSSSSEDDGLLLFAGINFYSRIPDDEDALAAMNKSAYAHGLGPFIDGGFPSGLYIVNHTGCTYPNISAFYHREEEMPPLQFQEV